MIARIFRRRWRSDWRVDVLSDVEPRWAKLRGPGQRSRRDALDCWLGDLLRRIADGCAKFHYNADRPPRERHDARAPAADVLDVFVTAILGLLAFGVLLAACILLLLDRIAGSELFCSRRPCNHRSSCDLA